MRPGGTPGSDRNAAPAAFGERTGQEVATAAGDPRQPDRAAALGRRSRCARWARWARDPAAHRSRAASCRADLLLPECAPQWTAVSTVSQAGAAILPPCQRRPRRACLAARTHGGALGYLSCVARIGLVLATDLALGRSPARHCADAGDTHTEPRARSVRGFRHDGDEEVAMVVVMAPEANEDDIAQIVGLVGAAGGEAFVSRGVSRTIIGLVGDVDQFGALNLRSYPGVTDVVRISVPYKLVSREHHAQRSTITVGGVPIGPGHLTVIAGPCTVETPEQTLTSARMAQAAGASLLRGGAFKPRTSPYAFQGLGEAGLRILAEVRAETGLPVVTEVIDPASVDLVCSYADMLQVGTRSMQNFTLLQAVGAANKPVLLKRGMNATIEEWLMAAEYIAQRGNLDIVLCERGIRTFETATRNTLDISAVPVAQRLSHLPVIIDPSHSGGRRDLVLPLSRAAIAVGADGIIVDVHPHPEAALCDGPQALVESDLRELASVALHLSPLVGRTLTPALAVPREPALA